MGCFLELLGDMLVDGYCYLMTLFLPEERINKVVRFILELIINVISVLFFLSILFGCLMFFLADNEGTRMFARYMIFVPLIVSGIHIAFGVIVRIIAKTKKRKKR